MRDVLLVVFIVIVITMIFVFNNQPEIPDETDNQPNIESPKPIEQNKLIGTWNAISEEARGEINTQLEDYSITFNQETYTSKILGVEETGNYKLEEDKITFLQPGDDLTKQGIFSQAYGELKDNQLILTFPQYPKTVIYRK